MVMFTMGGIFDYFSASPPFEPVTDL